MSKTRLILRALVLFVASWALVVVFLVVLYFSWYSGWAMNWGATRQEIARVMAGDELLESPSFNTTRAITISGSPEEIWPWIVQMGYKRAGFYALDRLDNAGIPSATTILPQYQNLAVGDSISFGGASVKVVHMVPCRSMLWVFQRGSGPWTNATWSWGLYPIAGQRTRVVSRLRADLSTSSLQEKLAKGFVDATEILAMRTCLRGLKVRVEKA